MYSTLFGLCSDLQKEFSLLYSTHKFGKEFLFVSFMPFPEFAAVLDDI